jgi:hypothetical protein
MSKSLQRCELPRVVCPGCQGLHHFFKRSSCEEGSTQVVYYECRACRARFRVDYVNLPIEWCEGG